MLDNIYTLDADAELHLTIMASLAQEESRKTSERVKWGQKCQMEKGVVFGRDMLGYDVINGVMHINEEGAQIVKLIFHKFVFEKKGCCTIARELREAGYKTITGNTMCSNTVILKALRNEKYCGDLTKEAYREKKAEYEKEIARLEKLLDGAKNNSYEYDADAAVKDVCEYIKKILYLAERDEMFYKNLVEKIVVHSREKIDVYLNLLPHKWSVVLNSALEQSDLCGSISGTTYLHRVHNAPSYHILSGRKARPRLTQTGTRHAPDHGLAGQNSSRL